jgi:hypothetical protein
VCDCFNGSFPAVCSQALQVPAECDEKAAQEKREKHRQYMREWRQAERVQIEEMERKVRVPGTCGCVRADLLAVLAKLLHIANAI